MVKLSFTKTWYYVEKHSKDCAAADARKIAVHSILVQWLMVKHQHFIKLFTLHSRLTLEATKL